ncbi:MAG: ABC transporter permease DevC [Microcoleaceae cyanobacterium]
MTRKIPLAWLQLTKEKVRLLVAMAGIGFADILMFMQLGFRDALFASAVRFHQKLEGDIFLISSQSTALRAMKSFSRRRLYQALAFEGVASISSIYIDFGFWRNSENRDTRAIMVIGFNPADQVFNLPGVVNNQDKIKLADVVLFDEASREEYGAISTSFNHGKTVETELENRRIKVGGLFNIGASFGADGNVITSDLNFLRIFQKKNRNRGLIDIGIVNLKSGYESKKIIEVMRRQLQNDVLVLSKSEFIEWEKTYWQGSTAIGFVFTLGAGMGFIVGIVIVYQILYTDVSDHLPEYATLKAMGYADRYFLLVVFQQSLILAVIGYIPGFTIANILYGLARNATSLPMIMTVSKAIIIWVLTMLMCCFSGVIAMRKLQEADPADIF